MVKVVDPITQENLSLASAFSYTRDMHPGKSSTIRKIIKARRIGAGKRPSNFSIGRVSRAPSVQQDSAPKNIMDMSRKVNNMISSIRKMYIGRSV